MKTRLKPLQLVVGLSLIWILAAQELVAAESNTLRVQGSTTLLAPIETLSERYMKGHPGLSIVNHASSSGEGIRDLINGKADIARSSRPILIPDQVAAMRHGVKLLSTPIGRDGVIVIVHPKKYREIQRISTAQLRKIFFNGSITSWAQLKPGLTGQINIYARDSSESGTGYLFTQLIAGDSSVPFVRTAIYLPRTPELRDAIARDINGITFLPADMVDTAVAPLMVGDDKHAYIDYALDNSKITRYPLLRTLYLITRDPLSSDEKAFIDFTKTARALDIMRQFRIIPIR